MRCALYVSSSGSNGGVRLTYVINAAATAWKNMASAAVRAVMYAPNLAKSANMLKSRAQTAKKSAMRNMANATRLR